MTTSAIAMDLNHKHPHGHHYITKSKFMPSNSTTCANPEVCADKKPALTELNQAKLGRRLEGFGKGVSSINDSASSIGNEQIDTEKSQSPIKLENQQ